MQWKVLLSSKQISYFPDGGDPVQTTGKKWRAWGFQITVGPSSYGLWLQTIEESRLQTAPACHPPSDDGVPSSLTLFTPQNIYVTMSCGEPAPTVVVAPRARYDGAGL